MSALREPSQPYGLLHGGMFVVLAEKQDSAAAHHGVDDNAFPDVGIQMSANHVRGMREGHVHGTVRALHIGRTTRLWEIQNTNDPGELVCATSLTLSVVRRQPAPKVAAARGQNRSFDFLSLFAEEETSAALVHAL